MVGVDAELRTWPNADVLLQVHDSVGGDCEASVLPHVEALVVREMEQVIPKLEWQGEALSIPADFGSGATWKDCG